MLSKQDKITVKVTSIVEYGAFCEYSVADDLYKGLIHISEFSDYYVSDIKDYVEENKEYEVEVLEVNNDKKQLKLSFKSIRPDLTKGEDDKLKETGSGFQKLKDSVDTKVED